MKCPAFTRLANRTIANRKSMNDVKFALRQVLKNPGFTAVAVLTLTMPLLAQSESAPGSTNKPDFSAARQFIQKHMVKYSNPSIAVAVARRGEILWEEGFGWADRENRIPATEHTMYYMASVGKSFTAVALMILQERKQLDLDRPINDYLGAAKLTSPAWNAAEATVRRVANHTAGLTTFNPPRHLSIDEAIQRYGVIFWPPGDRFDYSNLGYKILDEVVARISGTSYSNFMRTEIFWPLGMTHASAGIGPGLEKFVAQRYSVSRGLQPPVAGGVYCSAHDLARFGMFCLKARLPDQKSILPDAAMDAMHDSSVSTGDGKYSLSWSIDDDLHGYRGILAQGGTDAAQAWLRLIPSEELCVVALANHGMMSSVMVHEIVSTLLPTYREKRAQAEEKKKLQTTSAALPSSAPPSELVGNWSGIIRTHREDLPLTFSIFASGDVHAKLGTQLTTLLNDARFEKGGLRGRMSGDLNVEEDTGPERYHLQFFLDLRDGALKGAVETRPHPNLPFWVELKKQSGPDATRN
jgi:CubicO group peptidase (beta-lactamase class C family)